MSQKRKLEEYHDPDYPQNINKIAKVSEENITENDKKKKICDILVNEFEKEMNNKEREVYEINHKIFLVKRMLHKVCFAVISNYYNKRSLNLAPEEVIKAQESISRLFTNDKKGLQNAIHPSLKKILGSNEVNYKELLDSRPTRQAAKAAQSTIKEKFKTKKEIRIERLRVKALESVQENTTVDECSNQTTTVKECLGPTNYDQSKNGKDKEITRQRSDKVHKLNANRGVNLSKQVIAVGNTSKYIQNEDLLDKVSHKWLIYVQSKTEIPIEKFVNKVRFCLHPSYKPNDIVDVESPPFQLARRGWGEFPVRIQLYFHSKFQQKPVQFYHNLILDKTLTGLQTMGSETLVELWLRSVLFSPEKTELLENNFENDQYYTSCTDTNTSYIASEEKLINIKKEKINSPLMECRDNLIDFLNNIDPSLSTDPDNIEPTLILSPTTHTKLKISEAISSPNIQSKCNYSPKSENNSPLNKRSTNDLFSNIHIEKEEKFNTEFSKFEKTCKNSLLNEDETKIMSSNEVKINEGYIPLNIQKINNKLRETIDDIKEELVIKENYRQNNLQKHSLNLVPTKFKIEPNVNYQKNQIILKDGKVSIIDPYQTKLKKRKQISLLKPVIKQSPSNFNSNKNPNIVVPFLIDHDYTSPWKDEITVPKQKSEANGLKEDKNCAFNPLKNKIENSSLINSSDFISVVISDNTKKLVNLKKKITLTVKDQLFSYEKPFIDHRGEFELKFHSEKFANEDTLIEYCLKNVPLIDSRASDCHYKAAFPFVTDNPTSFKMFPLSKRKALEWLQCKYFSTLMKNHDQFPNTSWSTKEIILYARSYGFTSIELLCTVSQNKILQNFNLNVTNINDDDQDKKTFQSLEKIYEWISGFNSKIEEDQGADKINIDDENDEKQIKKLTCKLSSPLKCEQYSTIIPIEEKFKEESKLINEICGQINIDLKSEPVFQDVHLHISESILIKVFRKFLENLIRKSLFEIQNTNETQSIPVLEVEHIKSAILLNPEFEFLTSKIHKNITEIKKELT